MKLLTIQDIVNCTQGTLINGNKDMNCKGFSKDTRTIKEEDMYIGIKGEHFDGNLFWKEALNNGAMGVIVQDIAFTEADLKKYQDKIIIKVKDTLQALYKIASYKRNLYSEYNAGAYQGVINTMSYNVASSAGAYDTPRLLLGTDDEMFSINLVTSMSRELSTSDLFMFFSEDRCEVEYIGNFCTYNTMAIVNHMLYLLGDGLTTQFSPVGFAVDNKNIFSSANTSLPKGESRNMIALDANSNKFYFLNGPLASNSSVTEVNASPTFTISKCLAAGPISEDREVFVVKTSGDEYRCIVIGGGDPSAPTYQEYQMIAPDIENAVSFAFCENTAIFYYATPEKIYANIIAGTNLQTRQVVSFAPDDQNEKITDVIHYQQAWFGTNNYYDYEFVLDSHQTHILIVTYNETTGEGKIYAKPFNVNSGLFSMTDQGETYGGFGEITAVTTVPR